MRGRARGAGLVLLAASGLLLLALAQGVGAEGAGVTPEAAAANVGGIDLVTASRIIAAAKADPETARRFGPRTTVVQVLDLADGKSPISVRFVDYGSMERFSVFVDRASEKVVGRATDVDWPDYSPAEVEASKKIALADPGLLAIRGDWIVNNVTGGNGTGKCLDRRCTVVFLTPPDRDFGSLRIAIVDLGLEAVVQVQTGE